ncbi:ATP-binding protein [Eubacteriales bacterium DFI.9.88]|nr:ATP-binding protein [Eubacteriales bacterium DFI.9.88]
MSPLSIIINILEEDMPWLLLFLLSFRNQIRFAIPKTIFISIGYISCVAMVIFINIEIVNAPEFLEFYSKFRFLFSLFHLVGTGCICIFLVAARKSALIFFVLVIKNYLDTLLLSAQLISILSGWSFDLVELLHLILTGPLVYLFIRRLLCPIAQPTFSMKFWNSLWLIPFSFYLIFRLGIIDGYFDRLSLLGTAATVSPYIWFFITFITYYLILYMLSQTLKYARLKEEIRLARAQGQIRKALYDHDAHRTEKIRSEIFLPLSQLEKLAESNDIPAIRAYIQNRLNRLAQATGAPVCEHYEVDTILRHYRNLYEENQIDLTMFANVSNDIFISKIDISILLGNLLENALQACLGQSGGEKFVKVRLESSQTKLLLFIQNSFSGEVVKNGSGFVSSRHSGSGLGTVSVRNIVDKYQGTVRFYDYEQKFTVRVMIYNYKEERER